MFVEFTIPGPPQGKGRPRFSVVRGHIHTRTPDDTVLYENLVRVMYREQVGVKRLDGAIKAEITGYFPVPKSWSKRKQAAAVAGELEHTSKCDADNLAKVILDSLNELAYKDDAQVSRLEVRKRYGEEPRVEVRLEEIKNEQQ